MKSRALPGIMLALLLAACGGKSAPVEQAAPQPAPCPFVYVYAPGNYIIDIAGGADVVLDPMAQDFPLFCAPTDARAALNAEIAAGRLPAGDWRIYRWKASLTIWPRNPALTSTRSSAWPPLWTG